jgi:hypothetical protein
MENSKSQLINMMRKLSVSLEYTSLLKKVSSIDRLNSYDTKKISYRQFLEALENKTIVASNIEEMNALDIDEDLLDQKFCDVLYTKFNSRETFRKLITDISCSKLADMPIVDIDPKFESVTMVTIEYVQEISDKIQERLNTIAPDYMDIKEEFAK